MDKVKQILGGFDISLSEIALTWYNGKMEIFSTFEWALSYCKQLMLFDGSLYITHKIPPDRLVKYAKRFLYKILVPCNPLFKLNEKQIKASALYEFIVSFYLLTTKNLKIKKKKNLLKVNCTDELNPYYETWYQKFVNNTFNLMD